MLRSSSRLLLLAFILITGPRCSKKNAPAPVATSPGVTVEAERTAVSKVRTPEDVRPYDESLTWQEYKVRAVRSGEMDDMVIRVAHWAVLKGQAVPVGTKIGEVITLHLRPFDTVPGIKTVNASNDLDIVADEPSRFLDLAEPPPNLAKPVPPRFDYGGTMTEQMQLYWTLRAQLRLIVMGNSHATKGICAQMFFEDENGVTPIALNFAPPGSNMEMQCFMINEYVMPLPKTQWIVWVASPRLFNGRLEDARKFAAFQSSPGRAYDIAHQAELWPVKPAPLIGLDKLATLDISNPWGWEARHKVLLPEDQAAARQQLLKENDPPNFAFSEPRWKLFTGTLRELNAKDVRVLVVTLPMHPLFRDLPVADPDGTTHEGNAEVVAHLETLHAQMPHTWYRDYNHDTHHDLTPDDFYDADHLNREGSKKITWDIAQWMTECAKQP